MKIVDSGKRIDADAFLEAKKLRIINSRKQNKAADKSLKPFLTNETKLNTLNHKTSKEGPQIRKDSFELLRRKRVISHNQKNNNEPSKNSIESQTVEKMENKTKTTVDKSSSSSSKLVRGTYQIVTPSSDDNKQSQKNGNSKDNSVELKKAIEEKQVEHYVKSQQKKNSSTSVKASASRILKKAGKTVVGAPVKGKVSFFKGLIGVFGFFLVFLIVIVVVIIMMPVVLLTPNYSTLTVREVMNIYQNSWNNTMTAACLNASYDDGINNYYAYCYGDKGIDWRTLLAVYYGGLFGRDGISPETDLELATNDSILDNEMDSNAGNFFSQVFWTMNGILETSDIVIQVYDSDNLPTLQYGNVIDGTAYVVDERDANYIVLIPVYHRDANTTMNILGFNTIQRTLVNEYLKPEYDEYFSTIVNSMNYGPGDLLVATAQLQYGNTGHQYWEWWGYRCDWCVVFASWCGYQCGLSDQDGQLGIIPRNNDTTNIMWWYDQHPEAGTVYRCYNGANTPENIPIQPGCFIIWENDGNLSHQDHLSIIETYNPDTHSFTTIDGNSYDSATAPSYPYGYYVSHLSRNWSSRIFAIICPAYPQKNYDLEYEPLTNAIDAQQYPVNYIELEEYISDSGIFHRQILSEVGYADDVINAITNTYLSSGVTEQSLLSVVSHTGIYQGSESISGIRWIARGCPEMVHFQFEGHAPIPNWYYNPSNGYLEHRQQCNYVVTQLYR